MFNTVQKALTQWNAATSDRVKLQHVYTLLLVAVVFLSGLVALFNGERSRQLMYAALVLIIALATNFVVWSLLKTNVLDKLPRDRTRKR